MIIFFLICKKPAAESLSPVFDAGFKALGLIYLITAAEDFATDVCCSSTSDCDLMSINCGRGCCVCMTELGCCRYNVYAVCDHI